jgi:DNA-directed RNA polymerase subunit omega
MSDQKQKVFGDYEKPPDQIWTIPNDEERGVYRFVLAAARRARQLQGGARPLISTTSRKSTKIAMEEVREGKVEVQIIPEDQPWPPPVSDDDMDALGRPRFLSDDRRDRRFGYDRLRDKGRPFYKSRMR